MRQTAQVIRVISSNYAEVKVRRASACAAAHNCGSCDHCSMLDNAPEIVVKAENPRGATAGETVTVESSTATVMKAALVLYILPLVLFFLGYAVGVVLNWNDGPAIALGGGGFLVGLLVAFGMEHRFRKEKPMQYKIVAIQG